MGQITQPLSIYLSYLLKKEQPSFQNCDGISMCFSLRWTIEGDISLLEVSGGAEPLLSSAVDLFPVQMSCEIHSPCFHSPLLFRQIYFTMENPLPERADKHNIGAIAVPSQGTM